MSKEDELFDEFLRAKFESKEFTNKPHYWNNAQEMITQGRKNNSLFRPIIAGSIVLVAAVGLGLLITAKSTLSPTDSKNLTASAVPVGTSTTSTYTVNTVATSNQHNSVAFVSTPQQSAETANTQAGLTAQPNSVTPNHTGKNRKNRKQRNAQTEQSNQPVQYNSTVEVIDINGKTFTLPKNDPQLAGADSYNKTAAYITYASKAQKSFFAIEAGINMYNPGSSDMLNSVRGQIGVRYYRYVAPKLALSTGLTYAMQNQNLPARSFESTAYDFGKNSSTTTVTTQRLDYIELPVSALYQLAPAHSLTAGITLGYVIQSYDQLSDISGKTSYQKGYMSAINRWDTQLDVGYQYTLSSRLWLRTTCHIGLMDISNNALFQQNETHLNKGLRVTLGYKIF